MLAEKPSDTYSIIYFNGFVSEGDTVSVSIYYVQERLSRVERYETSLIVMAKLGKQATKVLRCCYYYQQDIPLRAMICMHT